MRLMLFYLMTLYLALPVSAAEFSLQDGTRVESIFKEKTYRCGSLEVLIRTEHFPFFFESQVPSHFSLTGFHGSRAIIEKAAYVLPSFTPIPTLNALPKFNSMINSERLYLPTKAHCKGSKLLLVYWSGGNCKNCEITTKVSMGLDNELNIEKL